MILFYLLGPWTSRHGLSAVARIQEYGNGEQSRNRRKWFDGGDETKYVHAWTP